MSLPAYFDCYPNLHMSRNEVGVLRVRMHSGDGPLVWNAEVHRGFVDAFRDIGDDRRNRAVILTGTADEWIVQIDREGMKQLAEPWVWHRIQMDGRKLLGNLLDIEVPMICAINGPARLHTEIALLCDVILCSDDAVFQDRHLEWGIVPGDGVHIVWPAVLGPTRGRYFLMTSQKIDAQEALRLGVVNEVLSKADLLPRAQALADKLARQPALATRYARALFTQPYRRLIADDAGLGLSMEGLSAQGMGRVPEAGG